MQSSTFVDCALKLQLLASTWSADKAIDTRCTKTMFTAKSDMIPNHSRLPELPLRRWRNIIPSMFMNRLIAVRKFYIFSCSIRLFQPGYTTGKFIKSRPAPSSRTQVAVSIRPISIPYVMHNFQVSLAVNVISDSIKGNGNSCDIRIEERFLALWAIYLQQYSQK